MADDVAHVKSLGAKEEVGDKLHTVGLDIVSFMRPIDLRIEELTIARIQ